MMKKLWFKSALLALTGTTFALHFTGSGCLDAVVQRILVANLFD